MYFDEFKQQLPDIDEAETAEWLESLDAVVRDEGENRARFLMFKLLKRARQLHVGLPPLTQTRYINTISPEQEPAFPGDEAIERRIRRLVRWNAAAMVLRANNAFPGIGGHPRPTPGGDLYRSTNHLPGRDDVPGMNLLPGRRRDLRPARSSGRISRTSSTTSGASRAQAGPSSAALQLMPDFWGSRPSRGIGPINDHQARFTATSRTAA